MSLSNTLFTFTFDVVERHSDAMSLSDTVFTFTFGAEERHR